MAGDEEFDVAIIGGGPAGSTCGALLRKYNPALRVAILEKERFPREHVGESQLPLISRILDEMGVWDKVEAARFPVKLGATYRWGSSADLWDFGFMPFDEFRDEQRPAKFAGQRLRTAFHVDRAIYDSILLEHAASLGCEVRQGVQVSGVEHEGDRVTGLALGGGGRVTARHYVDASGAPGVLARELGIAVNCPTTLRNIGLWGYWEGAEWPVRIGADGTRVLVLSIGCGWLWCIPLSNERTSIGFICPAEYYKLTGRKPEDLYTWAVSSEPLLAELTRGAKRVGPVRATRDWSSLAERTAGENWLLAGDAAGFGDPILAAGLMLAHAGAREAAYTILELERGEFEGAWLRGFYDGLVRKRVSQHIRFAEYWYAQNGRFTDLEGYTARIARDAGMKMSPKDAFRWLSNGGFTHDVLGRAGLGGVDFSMVMLLTGELAGERDFGWKISQYNVFRLNVRGAREEFVPILWDGRIRREKCYVRGDKMLPAAGAYRMIIETLERVETIQEIRAEVAARLTRSGRAPTESEIMLVMQALEVMLLDGWVWGQFNTSKPRMKVVRSTHKASVVPDAGSAGARRFPAR